MSEKFTTYSSAEIDAYSAGAAAPSDAFLGLSNELIDAMSMADTNDGIIMLLDIFHEDLAEAIRISSNPGRALYLHPDTKEPVHGTIYKGKEYLWCPFNFILGHDAESGVLSGVKISIQNVDPIMTEVLRNIQKAARFEITFLRKNNPVIAEMIVNVLMLTNVTISNTLIEGDLSDYNYLAEPICPDKFTPGLTKGLF